MSENATDFYLTGLANQHAVERQAIETVERQLGRMEPYSELHAKMQAEIGMSRTQADRLESLLSKHGSGPSAFKETVTAAVGAVSGLIHMPASDEVLKNVLSAIGFKAYEAASYAALIASAELAGHSADQDVLRQSLQEEERIGAWLNAYLPSLIREHLATGK